MLWFKSCPKCERGDMIEGQDQYGAYMECVQCGFVRDLPAEQLAGPKPVPVPATAMGGPDLKSA